MAAYLKENGEGLGIHLFGVNVPSNVSMTFDSNFYAYMNEEYQCIQFQSRHSSAVVWVVTENKNVKQ